MLLIGFQILDLISVAEVGVDIIGKGHEHKDAVHHGDDVDSLLAHVRHQNHSGQADEQYGGADLSGDQRAGKHSALAVGDQTGDELETFLDDKQQDQIPQDGMFDAQTDDQRKLSHFIRDWVEELAECGDHIEFPGDLSVDHVSQTGDCQNQGGDNIVTGLGRIEINGHIDRDQKQPKQTEQIRDGQYFFFPIFDHGYILQPW